MTDNNVIEVEATSPHIVEQVYQEFKDYFGEEYVDMQDYSVDSFRFEISYYNINIPANSKVILVYWPEVTISNEYNESVKIWGLYSSIIVDPTGKLIGYPMFIRDSYDFLQWSANYMHSHISGIRKTELSLFRRSCFGDGPLVHTMSRLSTNYPDLLVWKLFCWELDKYVRVESVAGTPYMRLSTIHFSSKSIQRQPIRNLHVTEIAKIKSDKLRLISKFIPSIVEKIIKEHLLSFSYNNGHYTLGESYWRVVLTISNIFIDLYNSMDIEDKQDTAEIYGKEILKEVVIKDEAFYIVTGSTLPIHGMSFHKLFDFKGKEVHLKLIGDVPDSSSYMYILDKDIVDYILFTILKFVNAYYGKRIQANDFNKKRILI